MDKYMGNMGFPFTLLSLIQQQQQQLTSAKISVSFVKVSKREAFRYHA